MIQLRHRPSGAGHRHWAVDVALRAVIALVGSSTTIFLLATAGFVIEPTSVTDRQQSLLGLLILACLISPILENGFMIGLLRAFEYRLSPVVAGTAAAALLALMHSIDGWTKALIVFPAFLVFASTYRAYQSRPLFAFFTSCCVHAFDNAAMLSLLLIDRTGSLLLSLS